MADGQSTVEPIENEVRSSIYEDPSSFSTNKA